LNRNQHCLKTKGGTVVDSDRAAFLFFSARSYHEDCSSFVETSPRQAQLLHHGHHVEVVPHRFGLAAFDFDDLARANLDALAGCRYLPLGRLHRPGMFSAPGYFQYDLAAAGEGILEGRIRVWQGRSPPSPCLNNLVGAFHLALGFE